jgi:hypothetical protein
MPSYGLKMDAQCTRHSGAANTLSQEALLLGKITFFSTTLASARSWQCFSRRHTNMRSPQALAIVQSSLCVDFGLRLGFLSGVHAQALPQHENMNSPTAPIPAAIHAMVPRCFLATDTGTYGLVWLVMLVDTSPLELASNEVEVLRLPRVAGKLSCTLTIAPGSAPSSNANPAFSAHVATSSPCLIVSNCLHRPPEICITSIQQCPATGAQCVPASQ